MKARTRWIVLILSFALLFQLSSPVRAEGASPTLITSLQDSPDSLDSPPSATLSLIKEEHVTSGVQLRQYVWELTRTTGPYRTEANVLVIDLHNPYVKLDVMSGRGNTLNTKQTVLGMTTETGAVAGMNGDFFHLSLSRPPLGPQISNQEWMTTPLFLNGWYTFGITAKNKPIIDEYVFDGSITAPTGVSFKLAAINRAPQWNNGVNSHVDSIHMYTKAWNQINRVADAGFPMMEVLVQNDIITDINEKGVLPIMVPENGYILAANRLGAEYIKNNFKIGDSIQSNYTMKSLDPNNKEDVRSFKMMIGGHTLMVKEGQPSAFSTSIQSIEGLRSRTGVGYSKDGRYVYLITVDNNGPSKGMRMKEFQQFMIKLGVWKGMNLDGGGSTTLVSRPLGEVHTKVTNRPEFGSQRSVVNGLGIYSLAPIGELLGYRIAGRSDLFLKEKTSFEIKAYDTFYNPLTVNLPLLHWSVTREAGIFENNTFTALKTGKSIIQVANGAVKAETEVHVIGREELSHLRINAAPIILQKPGSTYVLPVVATTKKGLVRHVPIQSIDWHLIGFEGTMDGNKLTIHSLPKSGTGYVIASYNDFSTILPVSVSTRSLWANFDDVTHPVSHKVYPDEVTGSAQIVSGLPGPNRTAEDKAVYITYNFEAGTGNKASYAVMNGEKGIPLQGKPRKMTMDVLGDASGNWVRMELFDADGKNQRIDVHRNVNWSGWAPVTVDLGPYQLKYPVTLRQIYVASPAPGQEERASMGQMAFDNIYFEYEGSTTMMVKKTIKLAVNRKSLTVNDKTIELDQAPILEKGTTLVPVRFIIDAMGGTVDWEGTTQKVTLYREGKRIELWIGNADLNVNGQIATSLLPPRIQNQRTMVPLRVISEQMGWEVSWDQATKSITLF